mmetsp:Transcript_23658/g.55161  ORF Transcript_23658/g.55161 Transcript_23658/m.55161 type:complete len:86 (+) Transcript_23658:2031-2288(+)
MCGFGGAASAFKTSGSAFSTGGSGTAAGAVDTNRREMAEKRQLPAHSKGTITTIGYQTAWSMTSFQDVFYEAHANVEIDLWGQMA